MKRISEKRREEVLVQMKKGGGKGGGKGANCKSIQNSPTVPSTAAAFTLCEAAKGAFMSLVCSFFDFYGFRFFSFYMHLTYSCIYYILFVLTAAY